MKKRGKGLAAAFYPTGMGGGGGGLGGMLGGMGGGMGGAAPADAAALLGDAEGGTGKKGKGAQGAEDIDFDAIEKALSGQAPMPPGLGGGLPGLAGKKK